MQPKRHSSAEELLEAFLVEQVEEQLDFEAFARRHPAEERELRRLYALVPIPVSGGTDSLFRPRTTQPAWSPSPDLREGSTVSGFRLLRPLGRGGMGEVWEAFQTTLERNVALKFIRADHLAPRSIQRFRREARAGGRLNHPNIVSFYDHGESEGRHWIAQELVPEGCTLHDTLRELGSLGSPPRDYYRRVAALFVDVAGALQAAHDAGVVHRDIKPQNILITPAEVPKIGDFGLARLVDDATLSRAGLEGTPHYMSPEQVEPDGEIDFRTDIFSLGAVLYEALTFRRAFDGDSSAQVLHRILHLDPPDPRAIVPGIPRELALITLGALEKDRELRYASMSELRADLQRFLRHEPLARAAPGHLDRARKWVRRGPARAAALALVVVLLATAAALVPALVRQRALAEARERQRLEVEILWAIDRGRLAQAQELCTRAEALDPRDPAPHVYLASGYAQHARFLEAETELARARAKGFEIAPPAGTEAQAHMLYGLARQIEGKSRGWEEAERHLALAHELDPALEGVLYPLYQVRLALHDFQGARAPLEALRAKVPPGEGFAKVVEALLLELDGRYEESLAVLDALRESSDQELHDLRVLRIRGQIAMRLGRMQAAEQDLQQHLALIPLDVKALCYLSLVERSLALEEPEPDRALARLDRALDAARLATDIDPLWWYPRALAVDALLERLRLRADFYAPLPAALREELDQALDELELVAAGHPAVAGQRAQRDFFCALPALGAGDAAGVAEAEQLLRRCLERDPAHLQAACLLAGDRLLWAQERHDEALVFLERARAGWRPERDHGHDWRFTIDVWTFGHAERAGQEDVAREARERALAEPAGFECWEAWLTFAEFLATARTEGLRDCGLALELAAQPELERRLRTEPAASAVREAILGACER